MYHSNAEKNTTSSINMVVSVLFYETNGCKSLKLSLLMKLSCFIAFATRSAKISKSNDLSNTVFVTN